ncbi:hypothetical protein DH2020_011713 [Rehmannia glutinosa]|uniref:Uncharacterized protein n=1 Tax=Rehmannia glutinosa TaxID=99300 RepID=A0ABR0XE56_REHGL
MRRSRVTEISQRQSPRGPPSLRTSSSDSDHVHPRPRTERTPKLAEGRARGAQSDPSNQKKLGTRIANLESQLGLAQEELKSLKGQLVSTEASKKTAQHQLEKKSKNPNSSEIEEKHSTPIVIETLNNEDSSIITYEASDDIQQETDVFEVPIEKVAVETNKADLELPAEENELKPESPLVDELALKNDEINTLKTNLDEKDKELENFRKENESLKSQLDEKSLKLSSAQSRSMN